MFISRRTEAKRRRKEAASLDRAVVRALRARADQAITEIDKNRSAAESVADAFIPDGAELVDTLKHVRALMLSTTDDHIKIKAAKMITDSARDGANIKLKLYEHDNPAVTKTEMQLNTPADIKIEFVKPDPNLEPEEVD